jgi:hypothetical protein
MSPSAQFGIKTVSAATSEGKKNAEIAVKILDSVKLESELSEESDYKPTLSEEIQSRQENIESFYSKLSEDYNKELNLRSEVLNLVAYLRAQGSPVATYDYARQIITTSRSYGADYKILVAIMGVESGFCNANYKVYNCFGYLNGVQYGSYSQAFAALIPKISVQYANVYQTNFRAFAEAYGIHNVDHHTKRLQNFYYGI